MKVLITGANGMLGNSLCTLYQNNHEVSAIHRDKECFSTCSEDFHLDIKDLTQLRSIMNQVKPDLVIHCAGLTSMDACEKEPVLAHEENVAVTENIARVCSNKTVLVYISTDQVYGEADDHSEVNININPINQYGKTKLLGERKVQELCTRYIIVRTNIFGWNIKPEKISSAEWIYHSLKKGEEITLFTDYTFSPINVAFLGTIIMQLVQMDFTGVINVGSPKPCSKHGFGILLAEEFGLSSSLIRKGSISNHSFSAPRFHKLDLNIRKLSGLGIATPAYRLSIRKFVRDRKERIDHY